MHVCLCACVRVCLCMPLPLHPLGCLPPVAGGAAVIVAAFVHVDALVAAGDPADVAWCNLQESRLWEQMHHINDSEPTIS